ncbi:MAG TPA: hemolysin family protein [Gemmatimonadales bacterium]|jgi:CBS domain containing-hemolysin-like protein|nr:hemolysin family protein [Gemmatimonadales bacterium]
MIWLVVGVGLVLAVFGAIAGGALIALSRSELTRVVSRRLRGGQASMASLGQIDFDLTTASALTSLGVLLLGAAIPALLVGSGAVRSLILLVLVAVPFVLFSGYFGPRWLTQSLPGGLTDRLIPVLRHLSSVLGIVLPARGANRPQDLRSIWREGAAVGLTADSELALVGGVMTFTQRAVREVMTPRTEIVAIAEDAALDDITQVFAQSGYSRIPVYRGTLDEIIGMLHAFDLFKLHPGDPLPIRPVAMAPASRSCGDLLLDMQRERRHLAVLLDEFGGTLGIATLEDLLEELVGEIFDEHDEGVQASGAASATVFETDGTTPASAVGERFGVALPAGQASTIGGLVAELAGRIPNPGERFTLLGLEFDVVQASPTRIERLLIRLGPASAVPLARTGP